MFTAVSRPTMILIAASMQLSFYVPSFAASNEKSNRELRKDAFEFLFAEFIHDKECDWEVDRLREVRIFDHKTSRAKFEENIQTIDLPEQTERVARFFDRIILRGKRLDGVSLAKFKLGKKLFVLQAVVAEGREDSISFRVPPLPLGRKSAELTLLTNKEAIIDEIVLHSQRPFTIDAFDEYAERMSKFEARQNDRALAVHKALLEEIAELGVEALAESLREQTEEFARIIVPSQLTAGIDIISINGMLADRRVSKIYEELSRMDADKASELAATIYEDELRRFKEDWENSGILPARKRYAAEALLFISAEFCSTGTFLSHVDDWQSWHDSAKADKGFQFQKQGAPDFLLIANLYANKYVKQNDMSVEEANVWLAETLGPQLTERSVMPKLEQRWLPSSDWTTQRIDLIADVPTFQTFGSMRGPKKQGRVLDALRSSIDGR